MTEQKLKLLDQLAQELGKLSDEEFAKGIERLDKIFKSGRVQVRVMPNERKLIEHYNSEESQEWMNAQLGKPKSEVLAGGQCCKTCINYEIYNGESCKNFCSKFVIYMSRLKSWDTNKDYCSRYESKPA